MLQYIDAVHEVSDVSYGLCLFENNNCHALLLYCMIINRLYIDM
ncbi:hypothetical protein SAMN02910398_03622 [Butyrivibrio sp. YAB3001]|nr:hypothetical protein SAMN02910398_03622 [Butyrivibrio sp. YAB3001]